MYWVINGCCNLVQLFRSMITQSHRNCKVSHELQSWNIGIWEFPLQLASSIIGWVFFALPHTTCILSSLHWTWCTLVHPLLPFVALGWLSPPLVLYFGPLSTFLSSVLYARVLTSLLVLLMPMLSLMTLLSASSAFVREALHLPFLLFQSTMDWTYLISDPHYYQPHGWTTRAS